MDRAAQQGRGGEGGGKTGRSVLPFKGTISWCPRVQQRRDRD